jgi:hypothetical protein
MAREVSRSTDADAGQAEIEAMLDEQVALLASLEPAELDYLGPASFLPDWDE